jgi:beta-N-acetylhexosaminidase
MARLKEKIGQLLLVGLQAEAITPEERLVFETYNFGGFVLFKHNCRTAGQVISLCRTLWDFGDELPPFIAVDEEGGRVHRLPPSFAYFPSAACIGAKNDPDLARRCGLAIATELALTGINLNFAPVLDVRCESADPIIGDRAFAADPESVIELAGAWTEGLRSGGIIPCGKHFPGHGAADKDSHVDLPMVAKSTDELTATELPPFLHASRHGIEAIMTAHVQYPALDPRWPATLSEKIVTGWLRQQLGYAGVVFSDDMEMKAISDRYGAAEAALLSIRAGVDALLFCHDLVRAIEVCECLAIQCEKHAWLRTRVDESCARIAKLKRRCLKSFTGTAETDIVQRLATLSHERLVAECYGSL